MFDFFGGSVVLFFRLDEVSPSGGAPATESASKGQAHKQREPQYDRTITRQNHFSTKLEHFPASVSCGPRGAHAVSALCSSARSPASVDKSFIFLPVIFLPYCVESTKWSDGTAVQIIPAWKWLLRQEDGSGKAESLRLISPDGTNKFGAGRIL
jgi:hypothetical protein